MKLPGRSVFAMLSATILAATCLGFGSWGIHKSSDHNTNVTFASTMKFRNGTTLPAGTYRMEVAENTPNPKVTFVQNGKAMATVTAKLVNETQKNENTVVDSVTNGKAQEVTSIRPSGWHQKLVFGASGK